MGLFEMIFPKHRADVKNASEYFKTLTAYSPTFTTWNGELYESALVRSAIDSRSRHVGKLKVTIEGGAKSRLLTYLRRRPNSWQTWGQFLYRLNTILDMQNTAFITPVYGEFDEIVGYFPILPSRCELVVYEKTLYIRYQFRNGEHGAVEYEKCGVLTKFQYEDDFFGAPNTALNSTLELIDLQDQGIKEAVTNSSTFRFMAKLMNFSDPDDIENERKRFTSKNLRGEAGGLLLFPNTYTDVKQIISKPYTVDSGQMQLIQTNVFNYFGTNEDIIQNKATGDQWQAFYEGAIEPVSIQVSDVFTNLLFTENMQANGNFFMLTANRLQYMSNSDKLNVSSQMADRGLMTINEIREIWNLPPVEDGDKTIRRGEYKDSDKIDAVDEVDDSNNPGGGDNAEDD